MSVKKYNELKAQTTPIKVKNKKDFLDNIYGTCECGIEVRDDMNYCHKCGKPLKWSDEE